MKWLLLWAILLGNKGLALTNGDPWPGLNAFSMAKGKDAALATPGMVTLINLWATWCDACKDELREMEKEFKEFEGHANFRLALVSLDKDSKKAVAWLSKEVPQSQFFKDSLFNDPEFKVADALKADSFPISIVVDKQGNMVYLQRGYKPGEGSTQKLTKLLRELLAK